MDNSQFFRAGVVRCFRSCVVFLGLFLAVIPSADAAARVPAVLQAHILKKVLSMMERYKTANEIVVSYNDDKVAAKDIAKAFTRTGIKAAITLDSALITNNPSLVYVVEQSDESTAYCHKKRVLCLTGMVDMLEDGQAEVAVGVRRSRPKIFINLKRLRFKGIKVKQELVRLSEVVEE